jgi:Tfp pilus assembly protein PilX
MKNRAYPRSHRGVVLILVVFIVALLSAVVIGLIQVDAEEVQIARNHLGAAQAMAIAEAGFNDELARSRTSGALQAIPKTAFAGGTYAVTVVGSDVTSIGRTADGFAARVNATVQVQSGGSPHALNIEEFKVD